MRVVLDANVLLSGALATTGPIARIMSEWAAQSFDVIYSTPLRVEVATNMNRPFFAERLTVRGRDQYLRNIDLMGVFVVLPSIIPRIATHPEDDLILATAVAGSVDFLVTGDRQLLALVSYQGIPIIRPATFAEILRSAT